MIPSTFLDPRPGVSPRFKARLAAALWLGYVALSFLGTFARRGLVVSGDAARTATNLLAHESQFRLGFAADLLAIATYIAVTAILFDLLRPVHRTVALAAAFFSLAGCTIQAAGCVFGFAPSIVLTGLPHGGAFQAENLEAIAYLSLKLYAEAYTVALVFFAWFNLLVGILAARSTFLPRAVGLLMALSGVGGLTFLAPSFAARYLPFIMVTFVGEGVLFLWLLVAGVNARRWEERAAR